MNENYILIGRKIKTGSLEVMQCGSLKSLTEYGLNHFVMFTILDGVTLKPRYRYIEPSPNDTNPTAPPPNTK